MKGIYRLMPQTLAGTVTVGATRLPALTAAGLAPLTLPAAAIAALTIKKTESEIDINTAVFNVSAASSDVVGPFPVKSACSAA